MAGAALTALRNGNLSARADRNLSMDDGKAPATTLAKGFIAHPLQ